jgi:molybdopterin-guanine dinucleotide biosynthesis protein A
LVHGVRIIDRVAAALRPNTDAFLLVANDPTSDAWLPGDTRVPDVRPDNGSLGGLHAALWHAKAAVLVVAWDMPFVSGALLRHLRALGDDGVDAVLPASGSRRGLEPMCAWYAPTCLPAIEAALDRDDRRLVAFLDDVHVTRVPAEVVARFGDPERLFLNVNNADELERANALAP